ncbi:queD-like protein [Shewanella sp. AS16]|uniref:VC2046/SO_2500 family protein n=1 Tax=Shewanella sp. AS16 TaxID=2907625 RepID=UPI001F1ADA76|nr:VC2046/SO_2500 family protein [Shewanella sp. AS16]MCE9687686.1 queD-like protein [Shewanella sp. AS16]
MQIDVPLVNEAQIGSRLNLAVESDRRGEFGLLLALLSTDARDMAQFHWQAELDQQQKLQRSFQLPPAEVLVADLSAGQPVVDNARAFGADGIKGFQLQQALMPEALVIRGQRDTGLNDALNNSGHLTRLRHQAALSMPASKPVDLAELLTMQRQWGQRVNLL